MNQRMRWYTGGATVGVMMLGVICWAGTKGVDRFTLANINTLGHIGAAGATVNFNYVLDKYGDFVGSASGTVQNHAHANVAFRNVGSFNNLTVTASLYTVDDVGDALYIAAGTKR